MKTRGFLVGLNNVNVYIKFKLLKFVMIPVLF